MKEKNVATARDEVSRTNERGQLCRDLIGGTVAMQEAGTKYISKSASESDKVWKDRVNSATLFNMFKRTTNYLSGQVFSKDVDLSVGDGKDLPEPFDAMQDDIDMQGNSLSRWGRHFFDESLTNGAGLVLVDFPYVETRTNGSGVEYKDKNDEQWKVKTAEADKQNGWRPYFVYIPQTDLLGWRFAVENGKHVLTQLRFVEHVIEHEGQWDTDDTPIRQVRVLEPGKWETWRETGEGDKKEWTLYAEGPTSLNVIPVVPLLLGERCGELCAYPALEDLAHLNRRHWQATADQYSLLSWMRRPVWIGKKLWNDDEERDKIMKGWGPDMLMHSNEADGDLKSISVEPAAVKAGQEELTSLEEQMSMYGMRLLLPRTGTTTATESALESSESDSTLKAWAKALEDCLDQAFMFAGMWADGSTEVPKTSVNTEFHILDGMTMAEIKEAVASGIVSKRMAFDELKRRGLVRDDADWIETLAEIENEGRQGQGPSLGAGLAAGMLGGQG